MASAPQARLWIMRLLFPLLCFGIVFAHLLPLNTLPKGWAPPDLILCIALVWATRRPDYIPTLSIFFTLLMVDLLLYRPPGLLTMLTLLGCEFLKSRVQAHRETAFMSEWLTGAIVISAITLANRMILNLTNTEQATLTLSMIQMIMTIIAYPLLAVFCQSVLNVRKLSPSEADAMRGH
ncbi:rod shape-determining protein MreD [Epibacterium ulvae]|uniref:rod shape-determining protein MreD n=1 Tax=Epibacterium ulvae TaxID=1156985 RepID=UPI00248F871B|nr:rod shape-determining protein MreD [Epibacterium ulvae]